MRLDTSLVTPVAINETKSSFQVTNNRIIINLINPSYVGYSIYDESGRLVNKVSLGYLPRGDYSFELNLQLRRGILRIRIGEEVHTIKLFN